VSVAEFVASGVDPVQLATRIGLVPDPWQEDALRSTSPRLLLCWGRQSGKSTVGALAAVHTAIYQPASLVLIVAPSQDQSKELFRTAHAIYRSIGKPITSETENRLALELESGSRIISEASSGRTVRGYSNVTLLIIDEAAYTDDELYETTFPMLSRSEGRLMALSTPNGKQGWFYRAWSSDGWEKSLIPATECSWMNEAKLAEAREELGPWKFRQELMCEFVDSAEQMFATDAVERAFTKKVKPLFPVDLC
jgi:hypothetical protein